MSNVMRETLARLMGQIEDLEERVVQMEQKQQDSEPLRNLKEELAEKQRELARISNGCGTPYHH